MGQIIALGGGGFSYEVENPFLDRYILELTGKDRPKVCFLPQASAESFQYTTRFFSAFNKLGADASWFSLFTPVKNNWRDELRGSDVIYVGGGNTRSMLALWRDWGVDDVLREMLDDGKILAGISAGAICWFEECVTDSVWPLGSIKGLGMLAGSACPHYDSEPERRPTTLRMIADGEIIPGIALTDFAAAHYVDGQLKTVVTSRPQARAYQITREDGKAIETELPMTYIGE